MRNSSGQRRWATVLLLAQLLGGAAGQRHDGDDLPNCYSADRGTGARQVPGRLLVPPTGCQALGDDNQQYRVTDAELLRKHPQCRAKCPIRFQPSGCQLTPLSADSFLRLFSGRRLVLWGDSVSGQHHDYLTKSLLRGYNQTQVALRRLSPVRPGAGEGGAGGPEAECRAGAALPCTRVASRDGRAAAEVCHLFAAMDVLGGGGAPCLSQLDRRDVVVFNLGLWYSQMKKGAYRTALAHFASGWSRWAATQPGGPPLAIWRETSPQHFNGLGGGFTDLKKVRTRDGRTLIPRFRCSQVPRSEAYAVQYWRNRAATRALRGLDMPKLRIFGVTLSAHDQHAGIRAKNGKIQVADCTHYCTGSHGIFRVWTELLINQVAAVEAARKEVIRRGPSIRIGEEL